MKSSPLLFACLLGIGPTAQAATGIFGSYVDVFTTTDTVYRGETYSSKANFDGANLGIFNSTDTLAISASQIDTYKDAGSGDDVTGGQLLYRVYLTSGTPGAFSAQSYGFQSNSTFTDIGGMTNTGTYDQAWGNTTDINLLPLASSGNGNYTVEVYFQAFTNRGDRFSNNSGNNFKATFDVVPEPASALLGSIGVLLLLRRRR